ncbi:energy transducer TonB [Chondromyces crocatus]|uniref:TonB C-terminal domain-containing protein n=1 Tax=Chondromyces crocatus TaxID=52 RepID=A0A0K1EJ46_CHOCO|nr:energy transducer TonB [Chondromyces crocatus]AKT40890.1 uncharacterized protein CMC5_050470 [Chondromyces crocatus]
MSLSPPHAATSPSADAPQRRERERERDPLAAVFAMGDRATRVGAAIGLTLALTSHGALSGRAILSEMLREARLAAERMRFEVHDFLWATYEVELPRPETPEPPKEAEPEPEPQPEPEPIPQPKLAPQNTPPPEADPYDPPPAAAAAPEVLTQAPDPNEIVDMTSFGIASGKGEGPGYGMVAGDGTAKTATRNPNAKVGGTVGGKGTGDPRPPPPPGPDRSRAPNILGSSSWNCPFPPEADAEQIDQARVVIMVTVRPDGSPLSVKVVNDPGHGFGRAARMCALGKRYQSGLDREGKPTTGTLGPITVRFTR